MKFIHEVTKDNIEALIPNDDVSISETVVTTSEKTHNLKDWWNKAAELHRERDDKETTRCPICKYKITSCQCLYTGSSHPNRDNRMRVVFDHLYLFSEKQISHLISLQKYWKRSYGDKHLADVYDELIDDLKNGKV